MSESNTIVRWNGTDGFDHRIQTYKLPGSGHWAIVKDSRGPGGSWTRDWATESRDKPTFEDAVTEIPSDSSGVHDHEKRIDRNL